MARQIDRLSPSQIDSKPPGRYADGNGLYLVVDALRPGADPSQGRALMRLRLGASFDARRDRRAPRASPAGHRIGAGSF